jgi:3alpha(or 20beta)-hydroxysteroid dehydrogenase
MSRLNGKVAIVTGGSQGQGAAEAELFVAEGARRHRRPFLGMRAVVPAMKAAGRGSIVNISSVAGVKGQSHGLAYNSTKFAVRGMTRAAALELADHGIRVNAVLPGIIDTPSSLRIRPEFRTASAASTPLKRWGRASEAAHMVLFLASDESSFCTGGDYFVDGGAYA